MRLESQEEYEAVKNNLGCIAYCIREDQANETDYYFKKVSEEAMVDWELVTKATPHIDAFYEAIDAEPVNIGIADKELAMIESILGSNHREYVRASSFHTCSQPSTFVDPNESMLGLVSQLSTDLISCLELGVSSTSTVMKLASLTVYIDSCREGKSTEMLDSMYSTAVTLIGTVPKLH